MSVARGTSWPSQSAGKKVAKRMEKESENGKVVRFSSVRWKGPRSGTRSFSLVTLSPAGR